MTDIPITGRLSQLLKQCKKISRDQVILSIIKGYHTPFISFPVQEKHPNLIKMSDYQILLVEKRAIHEIETALEEFLSNLFLVRKQDVGNHPVINLKKT